MTYVRLTFKKIGGGRRTVWAQVGSQRSGVFTYWACDNEGSKTEPSELIVCSRPDIVREQAAKMNLHYGTLEVVAEKETAR